MRTVLAISILAVLGGCAVDVGASSAEASEGGAALTGTVGVLEIERHVDADGTLITAAFARYRGLAEGDVLPLIGTGTIGTGTRAELDACVLMDGALDTEAGLEAVGVETDVELIDAGTVEIRLADVTTRLVPRTFPDVASVMGGVFYAGEVSTRTTSAVAALSGAVLSPDALSPAALSPAALSPAALSPAALSALALSPAAQVEPYVLRSSGSLDVGAFELSVEPPHEVMVVVFGDDEGAVARDHTLEFSWLPGALDGDASDVVEIELASRGGTLACRVADDGAFRIEPSLLAGLAADADAELLVRRVRTRSFTAVGLDSAYARLAITRTERVVVR